MPDDGSSTLPKAKTKSIVGEPDTAGAGEHVRRALCMLAVLTRGQTNKAAVQEQNKINADASVQKKKRKTKTKVTEQDPDSAVEGVRYTPCMHACAHTQTEEQAAGRVYAA